MSQAQTRSTPPPKAITVDRRQHRLAAALDACERILQVEDQAAQLLPHPAVALIGDLLAYAAEQFEVDAGGEAGPGAAQHGDAHASSSSIHLKASRSSSHMRRFMALAFSGRFNSTVATASAKSIFRVS
jgi:hypothetical protein